MNKKGSIRMGPGASSLVLIFVMLSLSVLAMLALSGANSNLQMGRRSVQVTEEIYNLYEAAEQTRAQIAQLLDKSREETQTDADYLRTVAENLVERQRSEEEGLAQIRIENGAACWEEGDGVYTLDCAISLGRIDLRESEEDVMRGDIAAETAGAGEWLRHNLTVDRAQMEDDWDEWS